MMPKVLWETTLSPKSRRLLRVEISDQLITDRVINELMGKDASARFRFIMEGRRRSRARCLTQSVVDALRVLSPGLPARRARASLSTLMMS
jgi:hypothetical protein